MREIIACHVESVKRLDEKKGVGKAGENNGEYCWSDPCIPGGYGNGKQEQRICHVAEVEALQKKRPPERHGDGKRRKTVAKQGRAGNLQFEVRSGHGSPRLDYVRARSRNRLSEEKDHTAEALARRGSGVFAGRCVRYPPLLKPLLLPDGTVFTELVDSRIVRARKLRSNEICLPAS